jgi:xanthine/uracil permease
MHVPEAATRALRKFVIVLHEPLVLGFQWLLIGLKLLNLQLKEIATEHHNSDQQDKTIAFLKVAVSLVGISKRLSFSRNAVSKVLGTVFRWTKNLHFE